MSQRDFRVRGLVDGLMDQTARLLEMREHIDETIARNVALTRQALMTEQRLRRDGNPERTARMLMPEVAASDIGH